MVIISGDFSGGKSFLYKVMGNYYFPGTFTMEFASSSKALEYSGNISGSMIVIDDTSKKELPMLAENIHSYRNGKIHITSDTNSNSFNIGNENTIKTLTTEGYFLRSVTIKTSSADGQTQSNSAVSIPVIRRVVTWGNSNQSLATVKNELKSRIILLYSLKKSTQNKEMMQENLSNATMEYNLSTLPRSLPSTTSKGLMGYQDVIRSLQSFTCIWQFLESCGAIPSDHSVIAISKIYMSRFKKTLEALYPLKLELATRFEEEQMPVLVKSMRLIRMWANICSNAYNDPDLKANSPLNINMIRKLVAINAHFVTEEDFVNAVSFLNTVLPPVEQVAVVEWMLQYVEGRGCMLRSDMRTCNPNMFTSRAHPDNNGTVSTFTHPTVRRNNQDDEEMDGNSQSQDSESSFFRKPKPKPNGLKRMGLIYHQQSNDNARFNKTHYASSMDVDLGYGVLNEEHIISKSVCDVIKSEYFYLDNATIQEGLYQVAQSVYTVKNVKFSDYEGQTIIEETDEYVSVTPLDFNRVDPITNKYVLRINIAWLVHMVRKFGCLQTRESYVSKYHRCTVMENVFSNMGFEGCKKYDILLPGEFFNHNVSNAPKLDYMSLMKIVKWGEPRTYVEESSIPRHLNSKVTVPNLVSEKDSTKEAEWCPGEDSFEKARYTESLLLQYEKGYYSITRNEMVSTNLVKNNPLLVADLVNVCDNFSPEAVRETFHRNIPAFKKVGLEYPKCLFIDPENNPSNRPKKKIRYTSARSLLSSCSSSSSSSYEFL